MSFRECIINGHKEGKLTDKQKDTMLSTYDDLVQQNSKKMSKAEAEKKASQDTFDAAEYEVKQRKRRVVLQRAAQARSLDLANTASKKRVSDGITYVLERDGSSKGISGSVEARRKNYLAFAHAKIDNILADLKKTSVLGRTTSRVKTNSKDMVREIFGTSTENAAAREMAKAWKSASDLLRQSFNRAGGDIKNRQDWGLPQTHDREQIAKATMDEWIEFIKDKLDWDKMVSEKTGKKFRDSEHRQVLEEVYETIITDGANKISATATMNQGRSLARRRQDSRFLVFRDADSWMAYNDKFGSGDVFETMMSHIEGMAKDISLMEVLGPNPNSTVSYLKTQLRAEAQRLDKNLTGKSRKNVDGIETDFKKFDDMYGIITGTALSPVNKKMARGFAGLGELLSAAQLGSTAILALFTDTATARFQAKMIGMPQTKYVAKSLVSMMRSKNTKQQYIRSGLIAENWSSVAYGQTRYIGDLLGPELTQRITNAAMNLSLLSPWTQSSRWTFGMELMGFVADNLGKRMDELPEGLQRTFRKYDITQEDLDVMNSVGAFNERGAKFMRPDDLFDANRKTAFKYLEMIQFETDLAVPVASVRAQATLQGGTRPGTIIGSLSRSVAQYKSFPITFMLNNLRQMSNLDASKLNKGLLATELMLTATLMAGVSIQLREITKGRDPIPLVKPDGSINLAFIGSAFLASGGLGIFGDFLFSESNRFGGGFEETLAGPRAGFAGDVLDLTVGNVTDAISGKETNALREGVEFLGRYTPGLSTWYLRLGIERLIYDNLRRLADPKAERRFARLQRRAMRDYGQEYWWRPGENLPDRSPNLQGVMGQ